ncbi:MAG: glycoside hydrolase 3 protein [Cirrosporium novae-zelandiae]|nr:MAG: glycoside hydrolase 3 protein [Cirrosporium novae-zelandiae]
MRFSTVVPLALAAAPAVVSAGGLGGTLGFALGDKKTDGSCKAQSDYEADLEAIGDVATMGVIRTYAAHECDQAKLLIPACKAKGFKVLLGMWPDTEESFQLDFTALKNNVPGNEDYVYGITVGSEALYRGDLTGEELLTYINKVQAEFPSLLIGTADSWNKYTDGSADALIEGGVELFLANGFSYWQGQAIDNATATYFDDMMQALGYIQNKKGSTSGFTFMTGETGWPTTGGTDYGSAIASTANAKTFFKEGVCGMLDWGVDVFYFEAFDEPWKPASTGDNGESEDETHWGAYTSARVAKFDLTC